MCSSLLTVGQLQTVLRVINCKFTYIRKINSAQHTCKLSYLQYETIFTSVIQYHRPTSLRSRSDHTSSSFAAGVGGAAPETGDFASELRGLFFLGGLCLRLPTRREVQALSPSASIFKLSDTCGNRVEKHQFNVVYSIHQYHLQKKCEKKQEEATKINPSIIYLHAHAVDFAIYFLLALAGLALLGK